MTTAGYVPALLIRQVESMEVPKRDSVVELQIAKHKTSRAGKPSSLQVSVDELVQLKQFTNQTKLRAESRGVVHCPEYVFVTRNSCSCMEATSVTKRLKAEWDKHFSESRMTKKVQVGKYQDKVQSEKDSHSKNRGGKKPNQQSGTDTKKTFHKPNEQLFSQ